MKSVWNTVGYYDLKNLSRGIQMYQTSKEHIHNHLGLKNLEKNCFTILDVVNEHGNLFKKNYNENVRLNHLFMEHLIDLVLFLGKQELAFRGHDKSSDSLNKGNFRELFEMHIIRCSQEIQNHYNSIKNIFTGMSKSTQNDLISCISEFLINQIKNEIKQCKFYSIQIDDTTDISQKTQCSIIIRYVTDKFELIERFLGFHNVSEDRTAQGLFNLVNSVLHEFDIENKLVGQSVTLTKPPKATRNESNNQSNFKILFYEIIDNILMQLNTRFQDTNKLLFLQLADVTKFKEYSFTFPVNALNNLKSTYPNIFYNINSLKVELEVLYSDVKYQNLLHIYDMVKIIEQDALKDILPEAYKLFILILIIPSTSVSNERSFSCLKRIKTCSRNSISQVRFSSLSILSIEKSLINQLKKN
ncbi:hypothetical protein QTP88_016522 [Uroleucon formosanum]